jgi:hypothetical protein
MLHIPILRNGQPYKSLDVAVVNHYRTREPFVSISQANPGLIRRDLRDQKTAREQLASLSTSQLVDISRRAAETFLNSSLPLGDATQSPEDYIRQVSATTGMPHALARRNMQKLHGALTEAGQVIDGLTRNIDWTILDRGFGDINGKPVSFYPRTDSLGIVLPSNSPGVHSLWVPAIPLKIPLILKPGAPNRGLHIESFKRSLMPVFHPRLFRFIQQTTRAQARF